MYKLAILFFLITLFLFNACEGSLDDEKRADNEAQIENFISTNNLEYVKENGVYHAIQNKGFGYKVSSGDSLAFYYIGYTLDGVVFDTNIQEVAEEENLDTSIRDFKPLVVNENSNNLIEGLQRGLSLCRQGEYATILFPSNLGFGEQSMGPIPEWSALAYDIFIIYVKNEQIEEEQNIISNFVASSAGFSQDSLTGAFKRYLVEHAEDTLPGINIDDTIYGYYKEETLAGELLSETDPEGQEIVLNTDELTEGIVFGFLMLKPEEKIQLVVSSAMGYGNIGNEDVAPYTPLLYELRLDSIK
ncbi:MAG: FKBP-type peptidyl-prolyl cis-trans isomerase [Bacteroidales bacterium]